MNPRAIVLRVAGNQDEAGILGCLAAAFEPYRGYYSSAGFADTTLDPTTLRERLQSMHVLVAVEEGVVVGTVAGICQRDQGHLRGMAVLPEYAGKGVAAKLLCEIEEWLRGNGCSQVTLDTTEPLKAAMRFYERHGYRRSGTVRDFFGMPLIEYDKSLLAKNPG
jgi:GNAT superfamily N-acetyltransferase